VTAPGRWRFGNNVLGGPPASEAVDRAWRWLVVLLAGAGCVQAPTGVTLTASHCTLAGHEVKPLPETYGFLCEFEVRGDSLRLDYTLVGGRPGSVGLEWTSPNATLVDAPSGIDLPEGEHGLSVTVVPHGPGPIRLHFVLQNATTSPADVVVWVTGQPGQWNVERR